MPTPRSTLQFRCIPGLLLAVGLAITAHRAVAARLFAAPLLSFDTGITPESVVIGDLNGDGKPDLVMVDDTSNSVVALLNNYAGGGNSACTAISPLIN